MMNIIHSIRHTSAFFLGYIVLSYLVQLFLVNRLYDLTNNFGNASILVIAHPDDETMFFGPALLNLIDHNHHLLILCLSSSREKELSSIRRNELVSVAQALGSSTRVVFANDPLLPDDMNEKWNTSTIYKHIEKQVVVTNSTSIKTLITFDSYGISGHPNHIAIHETVKLFKKSLNLKVMLLKSVPLLRKYTFFLDSIPTVITNYLSSNRPTFTLALDLSNYLKLERILELHKSQMVWFRQLYKAFSRYMFINDFVEYS